MSYKYIEINKNNLGIAFKRHLVTGLCTSTPIKAADSFRYVFSTIQKVTEFYDV